MMKGTVPAIMICVFFFSCGKKQEEQKEVMIAKSIPALYLLSNDSLLSIHSDTTYFEGQFFTGYIYELFENGDTSFVNGYFNGVEEGQHRKFYPDNKLWEQRSYINGKKQGPQKAWWPDGKPKMDYTAIDNEYEGIFREWNNAGLLIRQFHYNKGMEVGRQQLWWDNGKLRANYEVRNGRKYGSIGIKLCMNPSDSIK